MTDQTTSRRASLSGWDWIAICVAAHLIASYVLMPAWWLGAALWSEPTPEPSPVIFLGFAGAPVLVPYLLVTNAMVGLLDMLGGRIPVVECVVPWWSYGILFGLSALLLAYAFRTGWVRRLVRRNGRWLRLGRKANGT